jgi:hypothetical protein
MNGELPIEIGYKKAFGAGMLVCSVFILGVAVLTSRLFPQAITGTILFLLGIGYLTQSAIVIAPGEVQLKNLFGATMKTHPFASLSELSIVDGRLEVNGVPVKVARWLLSGSDWQRLEKVVQGRTG